MPELVGLIPAAGKGTRAYPYTRDIPKGMLKVAGKPLLEHSLTLLRDQLGIRRVYVVVGDLGQVIKDYFGDGAAWGLELTYIQNQRIDLGLAHSVRLAGAHIQGPFVMLLSDEYYRGGNHVDLPREPAPGELGFCGLVPGQDPEIIRRNYSVSMEGGRLTRLLEKPRQPENDILGTGTFLLSPQVFELLERAFAQEAQPPDFIGTLDKALAEGHVLRPFMLGGDYVNINDVDSLNWASFLGRTQALPAARLGVVIQSSGQGPDLPRLVAEFSGLPNVHEVLVVAPHDAHRPAWLDGMDKARWLPCPPGRAEYGDMLTHGLDNCQCELVALVEGAYCFYPNDLGKLLAYVADADLVLGTRTTRQLIQQGARMRGVVRLAHILLAKLIELLWAGHRVRLTDVGCTYRLLWRHCWEDIRERCPAPGPEFVLQMTLETLRGRKRLIEVPVSFLHTNQELAVLYQRPAVFWRMLLTVLKTRLGRD